MAPQLAVALHHRQRLAQLAARNAEDVAQLAFRRKTGIGRQIALRQVGAHLRQSTLSLIHAGSVVTWRRPAIAADPPASEQRNTLGQASIEIGRAQWREGGCQDV